VPRVSVIIAAYNAAAHIEETLASIHAQTYDGWEVVVADDASTDATAQLAREFSDKVRVVTAEQNLGPAGARNLAAANARGELLATLDSDDLWDPDYLDRQVGLYDDAVQRGQRVGLVTTDAKLLGAAGLEPDTFNDRVGRPREITVTALLRTNPVFTSVLCPRSVFDDAEGYDPRLFGTEDHDLWLRIAQRGYAVVANPVPLATYRLHGTSVSANPVRHAANLQLLYELALERGGLSGRQRRLARRQRRLHRLIEQRARLAAARLQGQPALSRSARLLPATMLVALEHPERWAAWLRHGGPRPASRRRHS
jgi:glycosyltransferase involved in cell wall biosynthesis